MRDYQRIYNRTRSVSWGCVEYRPGHWSQYQLFDESYHDTWPDWVSPSPQVFDLSAYLSDRQGFFEGSQQAAPALAHATTIPASSTFTDNETGTPIVVKPYRRVLYSPDWETMRLQRRRKGWSTRRMIQIVVLPPLPLHKPLAQPRLDSSLYHHVNWNMITIFLFLH